ncbi:MAG: hypothetical protein HXY30_11430 [Pseudorhodoplanes sp.]|nr:hypothetical protein [Pseudorhodoplanes sp.]
MAHVAALRAAAVIAGRHPARCAARFSRAAFPSFFGLGIVLAGLRARQTERVDDRICSRPMLRRDKNATIGNPSVSNVKIAFHN